MAHWPPLYDPVADPGLANGGTRWSADGAGFEAPKLPTGGCGDRVSHDY